ncbi:type VII secretion integral membrane protein EccD [Nocardia altamirensis]|uniref:type VII secretion integral membrane protein EccD n=1 Tax=Nocardia altamirensis TaxID=472158 RepID=UPI0024813AFE|nr:type VII secretion integral membrane protein EccD [Nocardia altamirensis]
MPIRVGDRQIDVDLAEQIPLEIVMEDLLEFLARFAPIDRSAAVMTLARIGQAPIPREHTLAQAGVTDGVLLELQPAPDGERFSPLVEEISEAVAQINERGFAEFEPSHASALSRLAVVAGSGVCAGLLARSWLSAGSSNWWCAAVALILAVAAAAGAAAAAHWWRSAATAYALTISALILSGTAGAVLVPSAQGAPAHFGAAQALGSAVVTGMASVLLLRALEGLGVMLHATVITVAVAVAVDALLVELLGWRVSTVAAGTVIAAMIVLVNAPKVGVLASRLRPPNLPAPGEDIDPDALEEVFDLDHDLDATGRLERRAVAATKALTGLLLGTAVVLACATAATVVPYAYHLPIQLVVAGLVVASVTLRARSYTDRVQATIMYVTAFVTAAGVAARIVAGYASLPVQLSVVVVMVALTVAAAAAARLPAARPSPVTRRNIELLEQLLIVALIPLAAWCMGVYSFVRNL